MHLIISSTYLPTERQALKALESNPNIAIKQADKGGCTVIQDRADYLQESIRLLSDNSTLVLPNDPLLEFQLALKNLVLEAIQDAVVSNQEGQFLLPTICSTPYHYHLPKVHKSLVNPPG